MQLINVPSFATNSPPPASVMYTLLFEDVMGQIGRLFERHPPSGFSASLTPSSPQSHSFNLPVGVRSPVSVFMHRVAAREIMHMSM